MEYSSKWIVSAKFDSTWFLGAGLLGYAFLFAHVGLGIPGLLVWWFFIVTVDSPHFFGTFLRTYLDREEWKKRRGLFLRALLFFALGPAVIVVGLIGQTRAPLNAYFAGAFCYGWWHIFRQHYGFISLYQRKHGEKAGKANRADFWFYHVVMLAPFVYYASNAPAVRKQFGLYIPGLATPLIALTSLAIATYALICIKAHRKGRPVNLQKYAYVLMTVPFYLLVFMHSALLQRIELIAMAPLITVFHDVQYHALIHFYAKNRYRQKDAARRFGLAARFGKSFFRYYTGALAFALVYRLIQFNAEGNPVPLSLGPNALSQSSLGPGFSVSDLSAVLAWGVSMNHYYLDQKIWRVSKDKKLSKELKVQG